MKSAKRFKVAMLTAYEPFSPRNGAWEYINKLLRYLSYRDDIELHVVTFGNETKQFKAGNLNIHMVKKIIRRPGPLTILQTLSLKRKIEEINPDIINLYGAASSAAYWMAAALIKNKYPFALTVVGIWSKDIKYISKKPIPFLIFLIEVMVRKYVIPRVPNIIAQTSSTKGLISRMADAKIYVVSGGVEFEQIQQIPPADLDETPDIFVVAGLERIKGVDILLKSIPIALKSVPELKIYIGGSGSQERRLKSLTKELNLEGHVRFLGFITEEKFQYYKACKIAIVPSRWDSQPNTLLEAMASGKPVVASNVGGIPDTMVDGETGFLFESENVEELADKIVMLLKDESLRKKMGDAARERARERDWARIAEKTMEVYRDITSNSAN